MHLGIFKDVSKVKMLSHNSKSQQKEVHIGLCNQKLRRFLSDRTKQTLYLYIPSHLSLIVNMSERGEILKSVGLDAVYRALKGGYLCEIFWRWR